MVRYSKKNQFDPIEDMKVHRVQRKYRGHKLAVAIGLNKTERRSGWGYGKRRSSQYDD